MVTKGERTRQRILDLAGPIFNARGYHTATLAEVMAATGLEKGGIYNHFGSKEDLALAAYDRNAELLGDLIRAAVRSRRGAVDRLVAFLAAYRRFAHDPLFPGGCPTLNTAVESHGSDPRLQERAREVMRSLLEGTVGRIVRRGIERGELRPGTDPDAVASVVIAGIEGALLLQQLFDDVRHVDRVLDHLEAYVTTLAVSPGGERETEEET